MSETEIEGEREGVLMRREREARKREKGWSRERERSLREKEDPCWRKITRKWNWGVCKKFKISTFPFYKLIPPPRIHHFWCFVVN
jgi:hypothetical protein